MTIILAIFMVCVSLGALLPANNLFLYFVHLESCHRIKSRLTLVPVGKSFLDFCNAARHRKDLRILFAVLN